MSLSKNCIVYENIYQRSEAWFKLRAGRLTASNFKRLLTPTGKKPQPRTHQERGPWGELIIDLCCSFLRPDEIKWEGNRHTDQGEELEPEARDEFRTITGMTVKEVGFVLCQDGPVGCSPDGLIVDQSGDYMAGLEIKCPLSKTHALYLLNGELPPEYRPQVHGSMAVTGLRTWYFFSYCRGLRPFLLKVEWDAYTDRINEALNDFKREYRDQFDVIMPQIRPAVEGRAA